MSYCMRAEVVSKFKVQSYMTVGERRAPQGLGGEGAPDGLLFSMLLLLLQQILCPTLYNHSPISFFFFQLLSIWTRLYIQSSPGRPPSLGQKGDPPSRRA